MAAAIRRQRGSVNARDRMSMRRVIIKQSYLTKLANAAKVGSSFKSPHRRWFVFGVMNNTDPYIEYYDSEDAVFMGSPINIFFLDSCKRVMKKNNQGRYQNVFTLNLRDRDLTLVAQTRSLREEWCAAISSKLLSLGIFVDDDAEHIYVDNPVSRPLTRPDRDRFYPNRPTRVLSSDRGQPVQTSPSDDTTDLNTNPPDDVPTVNRPDQYEEPRSLSTENSYAVPKNERDQSNICESGTRLTLDTPPCTPPQAMDTNSTPAPHNWIMFGDTVAHPVMPDTPETPPMSPARTATPTTPMNPPLSPTSPVSPTDSIYANFPSLRPLSSDLSPPIVSDQEPNFTLMTPKVFEASGVDPGEEAIVGWNMPPPDIDAPPLYLPQAALERGANVALKHSQVDQLQKEKDNQGGVKVLLQRIDCLYAIAFVDCFGGVWIAGWNQKARPRLHNAFHIGDQLISVNGQVIESAKVAQKLIKSCQDDDKITFIIKRLPNSRILAIKRSMDGEDLGIQRREGTAEIIDVDELGLASQAGLSQRAVTTSGDDFCNWWITEVNHRPLNMFYKDNEIERRLNAVGKDISILVQPLHFITELKRKLKAYRNYKDFLLE